MKKLVLLVVVLVVALGLASCSPKERGRWGGEDFSYEIGALPDDVCIANGVPVIYGASTESDGGFTLVYLRNNGDVVSAQWLTDQFVGIALKPAGELFWSGGVCPSESGG